MEEDPAERIIVKNIKLFGVFCAVAMATAMLFSVAVIAASTVTSPVELNGAYAEGTCGFSTTYATATTRHPASSKKTVYAYAYGYAGYGITQLGYATNEVTGGTNPVTVDAYPSLSGSTITGAKGTHIVKAGTLTWQDYSSTGLTN